MDLKSYTLEELEPYLYTLYSKSESLVPVSPLRLRSYLENPRAKLSDPVLYEMRQKGEVVGYRTLLPDCFYDREGHPQRFAWLSGNWVRPDMRRRGISTQMLEMAEKQWEGRLMYTNYAPESKALYDSTGHFKIIANREGKRFYLRSDSEGLLGNRMGFRQFFGISDRLINQLREKIGVMFGNPETTTGGNALKFYSSVRLDIRRIGQIKESPTDVTGNRTRVKVVKNKVAPPFKVVEFDIMYGQGISKSGEILDLGVELDIIKKAGSWFSYEGNKLGQGRDAVKALIEDNPELMEELDAKIRSSISGEVLDEPIAAQE